MGHVSKFRFCVVTPRHTSRSADTRSLYDACIVMCTLGIDMTSAPPSSSQACRETPRCTIKSTVSTCTSRAIRGSDTGVCDRGRTVDSVSCVGGALSLGIARSASARRVRLATSGALRICPTLSRMATAASFGSDAKKSGCRFVCVRDGRMPNGVTEVRTQHFSCDTLASMMLAFGRFVGPACKNVLMLANDTFRKKMRRASQRRIRSRSSARRLTPHAPNHAWCASLDGLLFSSDACSPTSVVFASACGVPGSESLKCACASEMEAPPKYARNEGALCRGPCRPYAAGADGQGDAVSPAEVGAFATTA